MRPPEKPNLLQCVNGLSRDKKRGTAGGFILSTANSHLLEVRCTERFVLAVFLVQDDSDCMRSSSVHVCCTRMAFMACLLSDVLGYLILCISASPVL